MDGVELSKAYFYEAGLPLLAERFPHLVERVAAGLVAGGFDSGCGSEIGGFDDEISRDHNWGPRFFLFIRPEDKRAFGEELQVFLDHALPVEFRGFRSTATTLPKNRAYVLTPEDNLRACLNLDRPPVTDEAWITIPEVHLFEYTAGPIYYEPTPLVSTLRSQFAYYPDNVWFKRLSYSFFMLHLAGNVIRSAKREDVVSTQTYVNWFLHIAMRACFLLERRYAPYCKWLFKAFKQLPCASDDLVTRIESVAMHIDLNKIADQVNEIADRVGALANKSELIEPVPLRSENSMIWTDFNCYAFANAFQEKIEGPLANKPWHEGPYDLLATNGNINQEILQAAWKTLKG